MYDEKPFSNVTPEMFKIARTQSAVRLTQPQIDAIANMEYKLMEWYWRLDNEMTDDMERICHVFICAKMGECVCKNPEQMRHYDAQ